MAPFDGIPSKQQQIALALAPKFAASLSIIGSSYIIVDVIRKRRKQQRQSSSSSQTTGTYHRLLIGLSVTDLMMSIGLFTSTWPMPMDTPHVYGAVGTTQTCAFIGFLEQAGVATVMYNASLSCYYLVRIRNGWPASRIEQQVEPWMHAIPIVFALITMFLGLILKLFNSGLFDCWIAPFPQGCDESWRSNNGSNNSIENPCIRGDNASLYQWIFDLIPKWTCILLVTINMVLVHRAVWQQERSTLRRTMRAQSNPNLLNQETRLPAVSSMTNSATANNNDDNMRSSSSHVSSSPRRRSSTSPHGRPSTRLARRLARQSYLYVGALYITYIPVIVTRAFQLVRGYSHYEMLLTISITIPLQGFWNVLVYLRPRYMAKRDARRRQEQIERARAESRKRRNDEEPQDSSVVPSSSGRGSNAFLAFRWDFLRTVSQVVQEGGLDNEEQEDDDDDDDHDKNSEVGRGTDELVDDTPLAASTVTATADLDAQSSTAPENPHEEPAPAPVTNSDNVDSKGDFIG